LTFKGVHGVVTAIVRTSNPAWDTASFNKLTDSKPCLQASWNPCRAILKPQASTECIHSIIS
jgi:hypothetical protein